MDKDTMDLTTATMLETDIIPILHIQSENLRDDLRPEQQKDGYLSIAFSENQRSLKAHLKLPFQIVGKVAYNANEYIVIACKN